jgi:4'-phosphopantetheinyl transferase EntD
MNPADISDLSARLAEALRPAALAGGRIEDFQAPLLDGEETLVANAVQKRRREFIAGRTAARKALQLAGGPACPILSGNSREPVWPEGYTGSITHCDSLAFAACLSGKEGLFIGIDVEEHHRLRRDLWRMVFTQEESAAFLATPEPDLAAAIAFSAKEAFEKAQFAASGKVMEFKAMNVRVAQDGTLSVTHTAQNFPMLPGTASGGWLLSGGHVFAHVRFRADSLNH